MVKFCSAGARMQQEQQGMWLGKSVLPTSTSASLLVASWFFAGQSLSEPSLHDVVLL